MRDFEAREFDPETLGWKYRDLPRGKQATADPLERKRLYDTTLHGYSNAGHTFGDALSADERRAVIEYLKTL